MAGTFADRVEKAHAEQHERLWRKTRTVLALLVVYVLILFSPFVKFYPTNIHGLERLTTDEILELGSISDNSSIFELPLEEITVSLKQHPLVDDAYWSYSLEGLSLELIERRLVAKTCLGTCVTPANYLYYAKGPSEGYVSVSMADAYPEVPTVSVAVWTDALASALWTIPASQLAKIEAIYPALDTVQFTQDVRLKLQSSDPMIYIAIGELPLLLQTNVVTQLETILSNLSETPASLICGVNSTNALICASSSFTN